MPFINRVTFCLTKNKNTSSINVPEGVNYIKDRCFANFKSLKTVFISNSVKYIGNLSFCNCT